MSQKRPCAARAVGFPEHYKVLAPIEKLRWLKSDECEGMVRAGRLLADQVAAEENRLRLRSVKMSKIVATPALLRDFEEGAIFPPMADHASCKMRRADLVLCDSEQKVYWPANYLSEREVEEDPEHPEDREAGKRLKATYEVVCLETYRREQWLRDEGLKADPGRFNTSSPSALTTLKLGDLGATEFKVALPPEDEDSLRAEVEEYISLTGRRSAHMVVNFR